MNKVKVRRDIYHALNAWYAQGNDGFGLIKTYIACKDNNFTFKEPFARLITLSKKEVIALAHAGPQGLELELTSDDLIQERFNSSGLEEKELILFVLNALDEYVPGVN